LELTIEKLIYGGDGLARLADDDKRRGKAVFVPFTLPGEKVDASVREEKPGFIRADAVKILQPSAERTAAKCAYFLRCGGCHYQHTSYPQQLEIKAAILKENLRRLAKIELPLELKVHASDPWNYRNRTRLQVRTQPGFALGYYKHGSHEVLPVETCPISSRAINRAITTIWELGRSGETPSAVREIEFFANAEESQVLAEVSCGTEVDLANVSGWAEDFRTRLAESNGARTRGTDAAPAEPTTHANPEPALVGVVAFAARPAHVSVAAPSPKALAMVGKGELTYCTGQAPLRVSAGSFFQVNRFLLDQLVEIVTGGRSGDLALDLYAGVGLFAVALARSFNHTMAVESSQSSVSDLKYNSTPNVKAVRSTVEEYLDARGANLRPDLVVADPPRAGLGERVARHLARLGTPRLVYVSCDPATLARDLGILTGGGYRIEQVHLVDLFPQTYHIETVVELVR
jgi:23S rRNA (uracil1939-C5)-methyltransferase